MDWPKVVVIVAVVAILYLPVMAGLMVLAQWVLFTPGWVPWAGPRRQDPFRNGFRGDPRSGLGLDFETVSVSTEHGPAESWLVPGDGGPLWAIYVHGVGGLRENGLRQLSVTNAVGLPTLMIGYRNDPWGPRGNPHFYGFGLHEWRDLEAAVRWAIGHGASEVVLIAESMGAGIAGQFLRHSPEATRVVALVLDSPALDFGAVVEGFAWWAPLRKLFVPLGTWLARRLLPIDLGAAVVADVVRDFPGPLFLAHGTIDPLVPVSISRNLVAARKGETIYLETRAMHLMSWQADPEQYREKLRGLLTRLAERERA